MQQLNYAQPVNPRNQIMETLQYVNVLDQMKDQNDARLANKKAAEMAQAKAKQDAIRQQELGAALAEVRKNPTRENYMILSDMYATQDPEKAKAFRENWYIMDAGKQEKIFKDSVNMLYMLESDPVKAVKTIEEQALAYENAGKKEEAEKYRAFGNLVKKGDVQSLKNSLVMTIGGIPEIGKPAIDGWVNWAAENRAKLESDRPKGDGIDESARKVINAAVESALSSDLLASQAASLADEFERAKPPSGWTGNALEWMKKATGGQDQFTKLKQEYVKLRNTDVLKNLPPGVASDKDIEIALSAFPDENANPTQITAFLRGMAKLQQYSSSVNKAKAEWVSQNGSLGPAQVPFTAGGKEVKRGMSFWDFTKAIPMPNSIGNTPTQATPAPVAEPIKQGGF